jgi:CspA family cold shock protein
MQEGTIARVMDKGYGFINSGAEKELFFHMSEVQDVHFDSLKEGDKVTFEASTGPKGPCAINVSPVEEGAAESAE